MGQYFKAMVIEKRDDDQMVKVQVLSPRSYDNFSKLTESAFIGNNYVNAVMGMIEDSPQRVAWMGDYADDEYGDPYEKKMPHDEFMRFWEVAWRNEDDTFAAKPEPMKFDMDSKGWYLVNHTQRLVLSFDDFIGKNKWLERYRDYQTGKEMEEWWCMSPLPLLTACGNGRGGGDYHEQFPDYRQVGTWAFDVIELTQQKPEGFREVMYEFTEQRRAS